MDYRNWEHPQIEEWDNMSEEERNAVLGLIIGSSCYPRRRFCSPREFCWPGQDYWSGQDCWPR
jgi:hypothetical protein